MEEYDEVAGLMNNIQASIDNIGYAAERNSRVESHAHPCPADYLFVNRIYLFLLLSCLDSSIPDISPQNSLIVSVIPD